MDKPVEIMRLVRIPPAGKLVVQIGKRRFVSLDELDNPKARQIILAALGELISFAGGYETVVEAGFAPPIAAAAPPTSASSAPPSEPEPTLEEKQAAFLAALERGETSGSDEGGSTTSSSAEAATTERRPLSFFNRRSRSAAPAEPLMPRLDIAGELNEILQRHLAQDPELRQQEIKIETGPAGGVRINVNGEYYEEAAKIADPMVRMVIKLATREWEEANASRPRD